MSNATPLEKRLYTAVATATSGRDGRTKSEDGIIDMAVAPPRSMGGNGAGTNPEQLFAAGCAARFGSAIAFFAMRPMVDLKLMSMQSGFFGRAFAARFAPTTFVVAVGMSILVGWWLLT